MTDSFKPILVAATAVAVEYKKGQTFPVWKELVARLDVELNSYHGKREDRTAVEQNVYVAAREACTSATTMHSSTQAVKDLDNLCTELLIFQQTMQTPPQAEPVVPEGAFATVEDWTNTSAWGVINAAQNVIEEFYNGGDSVSDLSFTALVGSLTEAWKAYVDGGEVLEPKLTPVQKQAVTDFLKAHRLMRVFGDALAPAMKLLTAVFGANPVGGEPVEDEPDEFAEEPYLYILMRNDLVSMNAGKAVAQGTHASNQMVFEANKRSLEISTVRGEQSDGAKNWKLLDKWQNLANGFGTCICLAVNEEQMRAAVAGAKEAGLHAGITHDPSYPLKDGASLHLLPLDTCAYIFGKKGDCKPFTRFPLMP